MPKGKRGGDNGGSDFWTSRDKCSAGHEYTPEHTYWKKYRTHYVRICKVCQRKYLKEHRARKGLDQS